MVVFPIIATLISLACAVVVARDAWRRPKPDKVAWAIAFAVFAVAAGAEVAGSLAGWTPLLVRAYYLAGAVLVVGYLALGELYLLAPRRVAAIGPGAALLVTALAVTVVLDAPIDPARLEREGWEAIERGPALIALAASINALGTLILVGGALVSAWRFWRRGVHRQRMIGCLLIAGGTLLVATGGTLTRFGHREYLYVAMAAGVAVIFAGYLRTRRPDRSLAPTVVSAVAGSVDPGRSPTSVGTVPRGATAAGAPVSLSTIRGGRRPAAASDDPAIAFLEGHFLPLDDAAMAEAGRVWSVDRVEVEHYDRTQARRVWDLRLRLSADDQAAFDAHSVPAKLQMADLYHDVLAPGVAALAEERRSAHGS